MRKILCVLLVIAMTIGIVPSVALAIGEQAQSTDNISTAFDHEASPLVDSDGDEGLFIHMDFEGHITLEPNIPDRGLVFDGDFIHIRLPMEISTDVITLSLPEDWTYDIDYEEETLHEPISGASDFREPKTYTIVTVQHTWNSFMEEPRQRDILPLVTPIPEGFTSIILPERASSIQWNNAFAGTGNRLIRVQGDQPNMPGTFTIAGRHVIIASEGTNLTDNTFTGTRPYTITLPSGSGRHFDVRTNGTLTLVHITLDGAKGQGLAPRGGVNLYGWPATLRMLPGSEIRDCRAELGGGILADHGSTVLINGGTLRGNEATSNFYGGGGGAGIRWRSSLTLQNAHIINNEAVADYGHGGGLDIVNESLLTIEGDTVIRGNRAGRRGGGVSIWYNSDGVMENGQIVDNSAFESGGGVVLTGANLSHVPADSSTFTMKAGTIEENRTVERGGGISGIHPDDIFESIHMGVQEIIINGGEIRENTSANGGGVWFHSGTFETTGGQIIDNKALNGAGVYWAEGPGVWETEGGEINIHENKASGNGGGLATVGPHNRTIPARVNIQRNEAQNGGGVWMGGSGTLTMNNMTNPIQGNEATGNGGGVYISTGTFTQGGSSITENNAIGDGGGIYVVHGSGFTGTDGSIIDNIAYDGGGLYVPHNNLGNVSIATNFVFDQNFARNGLRIDSDLAERWRTTIHPDTVTLAGEFIIDEVPEGTGNFKDVDPHAFTNYDINSDKPIFWRVTYEGIGGEGKVLAFTETNHHPIKYGALLPGGTVIRFDANPIEQFERWTVETRDTETTAEGKEAEFTLTAESRVAPLQYILAQHTHVVGYFQTPPSTTTLTVSKEVTGDLANRIIAFDFTVILQDSTGNPQSTGEPLLYTVTDSNQVVLRTGALTLDNEGRAMFSLRHGQRIHITEVPLEGSVQIVEALDDHYQAWFTDSESVESKEKGHDTGLRSMTEDRVFHFENARFEVPATGIALGSTGGALLLLTLISIPAFATLLLPIGRGRHKKLN